MNDLAEELERCPNVKHAQLRPFDAPEQFLVPEPLRDRVLAALRRRNARVKAMEATDAMVEAAAKAMANEESYGCSTIERAVLCRENWRRLIPEARAIVNAALATERGD